MFENVPSLFNEEYIRYDHIYGKCFIKRGSKKIPLTEPSKIVVSFSGYLVNNKKSSSWRKFEEIKREGLFLFEDGDTIITEEDGYLMGLSCFFPGDMKNNESRSINVMFPNSEVLLRIKTLKRKEESKNPNGTTAVVVNEFQVIESFELKKGLFTVLVNTTEDIKDKLIIPPKYPSITFKPMMGEFGSKKSVSVIIELTSDYSIVIFGLVGLFNSVVHDKTKITAGKLDPSAFIANPKITATKDAIYITDLQKNPDKRIFAVREKLNELMKFFSYTALKKGYEESSSKETFEKTKNERVQLIKQEITNEECMSKPDQKLIAFLKNQLKQEAGVIMSKENKNLYESSIKAFNPNMSILISSLPQYNSISESDKIVIKDVKRTTKNYMELVEENIAKEHKLSDELRKLNLNDVQFQEYKRMLKQGKAVPPKIRNLIKKQEENRTKMESGVKTLGSSKGVIAQTANKSINQVLKYNIFDFVFTKIEKGTELNFSKAPPGKEYLMVYFDVTNKGKGQQFMYPDEEVRVIINGETIPLRNYRMETNMDSGRTYKDEQFFFVVPEDTKEFILELGKKILPKTTIKMKI